MSATIPQTDLPPAQTAPPRKRTSAERQRHDNYTRPVRWAGVTAQSSEGRLIRAVRADLIRHVGGKPSPTQRVLIERAVMLSVHLARLDVAALKGNQMSDHSARQYLAWSNTLSRTIRIIGLNTAAERAPTLQELWVNSDVE